MREEEERKAAEKPVAAPELDVTIVNVKEVEAEMAEAVKKVLSVG